MDGVAVQSNLNTARNAQLFGRSKGANGPRKVLAEISNVQSNKAVTFDTTCHKSVKKSLQVSRSNINTPGARSAKAFLGGKSLVKTPAIRSGHHGKGASNSIKIYEDTKYVHKKPVLLANSNYDVPDCKEYMAPCTDREFHIPLPDYVEKVMKLKPTFNIDYFPYGRDVPSSEEYIAQATAECMNNLPSGSKGVLVDDDLLPMISSLNLDEVLPTDSHGDSLSDLKLLDEDENILFQIESDESFSLERLDEEIRSAGLEVPLW